MISTLTISLKLRSVYHTPSKINQLFIQPKFLYIFTAVKLSAHIIKFQKNPSVTICSLHRSLWPSSRYYNGTICFWKLTCYTLFEYFPIHQTFIFQKTNELEGEKTRVTSSSVSEYASFHVLVIQNKRKIN